VSFDVYVQFFEAGRAIGIAPELVRAAFAGQVEVVDDDYWILRFGDESTDLFLGPAPADATRLHSLAFHRPVADDRLWRGIFALLDAPGAVFHFPGGGAPRVRRMEAIDAMPAPLRDAMGPGVIVRNAGELANAIANPT
jgi:hypothetical protein